MHQVHHLAILLDTLHIDRGRNGHPAIVLSGLQWSPSYCACNGYPAIVLSGLQWSPSYCAIGFAMVTQLLCYRVCNGHPAIVLSGLQWSPSYSAIGFAVVTSY